MFGDVLQPTGRSPAPSSTQPSPRPTQQAKLISGDLDLSLQSLVQNLGISGSGAAPHQAQKPSWGSPAKNTTRTGGQNWTVPAATGLTGAPQRPMVSRWP